MLWHFANGRHLINVPLEWASQASLASHILTIKKGCLDGKIFSVVVFSSIKKDDSIIKKVTVDWYLVLVG